MRAPFHIFPLGDAAATIDLGNCIDESLNRKVLAMRQWLQAHSFEGLKDILAAYSSLTVYYNPVLIKKVHHPTGTVFAWVSEKLEQAYGQTEDPGIVNKKVIRIPVCYETPFSPDLDALARQKQLSTEEVIRIHCDSVYNVYMIGFLPGFSYMGQVSEQIAVPRKQKPVPVVAGSVGIAGVQTGIYPLNSPGGWQIIGRTPMKLFDPHQPEPVVLHAGDQVQFFPVSKKEFEVYRRS